jgi:hypothetical protein
MLVISIFSYKLLVMLNINIPRHRECTIISANLKIFFESGKKFFSYFCRKLILLNNYDRIKQRTSRRADGKYEGF